MDRAVGYGLKLPSSFHDTHPGAWVAARHEPRAGPHVPERHRRRRPRAARGRRFRRGHNAGDRRSRRHPCAVALQAVLRPTRPDRGQSAPQPWRISATSSSGARPLRTTARPRAAAGIRSVAEAFRRFALGHPRSYELIFLNLPAGFATAGRAQCEGSGAARRAGGSARGPRPGARGRAPGHRVRPRLRVDGAQRGVPPGRRRRRSVSIRRRRPRRRAREQEQVAPGRITGLRT